MKKVCIFCGALKGKNPIYAEAAKQLGKVLAENQLGLVYGGGNVGLMGIVANSVMENGGTVIGVIPKALEQKELRHKGITELHVVETMHERKALMAELSDAFIAMPGGFGTFEEFFEVTTWLQLGAHKKPCGILNAGGFYSHLLTFIEHASSEGFITPEDSQLIVVEEAPGALIEGLKNFVPRESTKWLALEQT